ncbi:ABC transporter permease [Agrobacterium tomkonis]|uniref:ABC transporter permease n=1 Tax=Agrobacterium tomkonis TaxID=1183410 RepID=UPI0032DA42D4
MPDNKSITKTGSVGWRLFLYVATAVVILFMVLPILAILPLSFNGSQFLAYPMRGASAQWYGELISSPKWSHAIWNSLLIGSSAAIIATILGTTAALGLWWSEYKGKAIVTAFLLSPMVVPVVVFGVGLSLFLGPLGLVRSYTSIILAHAALGSPFVVITVGAALASYDRNLTRAALGLGAEPIYAFRRVMLPLIVPGVLSGAVFAFATSFDEVVVVMLIGGPEHRTLPREMFSAIRENLSPTIAAAATVMTIAAIAVVACVQILQRPRQIDKAP